MVRWRALILSLKSGDGIPVLVEENEVCQEWKKVQDNTMPKLCHCWNIDRNQIFVFIECKAILLWLCMADR